MKITELQPMQGNVELIAEIAEIGEIRQFNKFGKSGRVATAKLKDDSGEIELSLWNEQIDQFSKGDTVKVSNGYVKEYQGEMQLTTGMRGTIELVKKAAVVEITPPKEQSTLAESHETSQKPDADEEDIED